MKKAIGRLLCVMALFCSGCATRMMDFTIISSKNIDFANASTFKRGNSRACGQDKVHLIAIFPTGVPNAKEATDQAIESVPGAVALLDGVISQRFWFIPFIYGQQSFIVEGTPLIDPKLASVMVNSK